MDKQTNKQMDRFVIIELLLQWKKYQKENIGSGWAKLHLVGLRLMGKGDKNVIYVVKCKSILEKTFTT